MLTRKGHIKCDECGRMIGYDDLAKGLASHRFVNPDAYGCEETYESQCRRCKGSQT